MHSVSHAALTASIIVALNLPTALAAPATHGAVQAQVPQASDVINDSKFLLLRSGIFDPTTQQLDFSATGAAASADSRYLLVQFRAGRLDARKRWSQQGVDFLGYVPNNAYFVRLHGATLTALRADPAVRWAGPVQAGMKLDPALWTGNRATAPTNPDGSYEIVVFGFRDESAQRLAGALNKVATTAVVDVVTARADAPRVRAHVDAAGLPELIRAATALEGVSWIAPYWQPQTANDAAVGPMQGNADSCTTPPSGAGQMPSPCASTPLWNHGIIGTNQIIGIADTGLDHNEAWFSTHDDGTGPHVELTDADNPPPVPPATGAVHPQNKVYAYWVQPGATAYDNNGMCPYQISGGFHGTHTSGTLAGDSSGVFGGSTYVVATPTNPNHDHGDGMAPNAQILFQDIGNDTTGCLVIDDLRAMIEQAFDGGARIHSDSWGFGVSEYTGYGADVDHELWNLQDMLIAFAAGNSGPGSNSIWSPANAKNVLAVGALGHGNSTTVASFSSRGPTADGRLKPDIMAPGMNTVSALGNNDNSETIQRPLTQALSGTSMATPTIAGNGALMRQYFTDGYYPRGVPSGADALNPSGMLMKAVLLNGTNTLQTSWPNNNIGWGRMWLDQNLYFSDNGGDAVRMRYWERTNAAGLATGEEHDYTLENVGASQEFRVSLVWYDPEGALSAGIELVNNLDLEVVAPDSTVYKGNVLSNGVSISGGNADILNPVEMVRFTVPLAGAYTLRVKATAVPGNGDDGSDRQGYALVAMGAFGLPDQPAFAAPTGLNVASNDTNGIAIGFTSAGGSQGFQLYRTDGTCAAADLANLRTVATGAASPLVDNRTQGGYSYAYAVRGVSNDIEGDISSCQDVVSNDTCSLLPTFDQTAISTDGSNASCSVQLAWSTAISNCPAATSVSYTIERDTEPYFPAPVTLASNVSATNYDDAQVTNGQPYYYRVIAIDGDGNQSTQPRTLNVTPSGAGGPDPSTFLDDVDTHTYMSLQTPWQITNTAASNGTFSYHSAGDNVTYPSNACARIYTPTLTLPANVTLSYVAQYNLEFQWDGVVVEISTDGGTTWNDLPPDAGYPSDFSQTGDPPINVCGYAAAHGAFNGKSTAGNLSAPNDDPNPLAFHTFTSDLAVYAGQSVQIRWSLSSDYATEYEGFFLDQVQIDDGVIDRIFKDGFDAPGGGGACR